MSFAWAPALLRRAAGGCVNLLERIWLATISRGRARSAVQPTSGMANANFRMDSGDGEVGDPARDEHGPAQLEVVVQQVVQGEEHRHLQQQRQAPRERVHLLPLVQRGNLLVHLVRLVLQPRADLGHLRVQGRHLGHRLGAAECQRQENELRDEREQDDGDAVVGDEEVEEVQDVLHQGGQPPDEDRRGDHLVRVQPRDAELVLRRVVVPGEDIRSSSARGRSGTCPWTPRSAGEAARRRSRSGRSRGRAGANRRRRLYDAASRDGDRREVLAHDGRPGEVLVQLFRRSHASRPGPGASCRPSRRSCGSRSCRPASGSAARSAGPS